MDRTSQRRKDNRSSNRYWSLMIVGEHGQVISMQRVKPLIWMAAVCLVTAIVVAAVALYLYLDQRQKAAGLAKQLHEMEYKLDALKEEKDILVAKLVIAQQQNRRLLEGGADQGAGDKASRAERKPDKAASAGDMKKTSAGPAAARNTGKDSGQKVTVGVDIQRFQVTYDPMDQVLKATFRVINVSRPKVGVSGRAVVVFKATGSPPIKWLASPRVKLVDGEPDGKRGKLFRINNFKTMTFLAYRVALPVVYDTASVYVFDRQGKLLLQREFEFTLPREPAAPEASKPSRPKAAGKQGKPRPPAAQKTAVKDSKPHGPDPGSVDKPADKRQTIRQDAAKENNSPGNTAAGADTGSAPKAADAGAGNDVSRAPSAVQETAPGSTDPGLQADPKPESDK